MPAPKSWFPLKTRRSPGGELGQSRLVFIINGLYPGGAERQLVYLAVGLRERGWEVHILTLTPADHPEFTRRLKQAQIPVVALQSDMGASLSGLRKAFAECLRQVRTIQPAVLVGFLVHGSLFARIVGRLAGVPRIITSLRSTHSRRSWHDTLLAVTRGLDHVLVTNSIEAAEAQIRAGVTTPQKSIVIANGFDLSRVRAPLSAPRAESPGPFTWLAMAGFRPEKGHAILLKAAEILSRERSFRLLLAGDGPELDSIKALAGTLGIDGSVEFLGNCEDVASLIHSAHAFVLSSAQEGMPNALIEALAGGLPAVTTDVGGCRGLLEAGNSGYLVPPGDPAALARAMALMMDLPAETRTAMGEGGRHVLKKFSMETMISRWATVLQEGDESLADAVSNRS